MSKIHFTKMHGCGNDYIYVNTMQYDITDPASGATATRASVPTDWYSLANLPFLRLILPCAFLMPTVARP